MMGSLTLVIWVSEKSHPPYSWKGNNFNPPLLRNKFDYTDLFFLLFLKQTSKETDSEIKITPIFNNSSNLTHCFELVKWILK